MLSNSAPYASRFHHHRLRSSRIGSVFYPPLAGYPGSYPERLLVACFLMSLTWGTAATALGGTKLAFAGKQFAGYVWVIQGTLAGLSLALCTRRRAAFPLVVWLPWLIWIIVRCDFDDFYCVQRTIMLWAGPLAALSMSAIVVNEQQLSWLLRSLRVIVVISLVIYIMSLAHALPSGIWFSGSSLMTACLAASALAPNVLLGRRKDILLWLGCLAMCCLSVFRAVIVTCALTLPLTPSPQPMQRRLIAVFMGIVLVLAAFSLPATRQKMLMNSGQDSLRGLAAHPGDVYSSGRFSMWRLYMDEALKQPLLGHGGNASYYFGVDLAGWEHPHSDYIRVFFDYGLIGVMLLGLPVLHTLVDTYRRVRLAGSVVTRDAWTVSCGGFISMCLLAITDNVLLYVAFFGCLLFGILGAAYGVSAAQSGIRPRTCDAFGA